MRIPKLQRHYEKIAELKKKLSGVATLPFEGAARLADGVVQKWLIDLPNLFSKETDAGGSYSWSLGGGWNVAHEHCVRYVMYHHSGQKRTLIGLGYDLRHWILDGDDKQIPWRVWFYTPEIPEYVQKKLQAKFQDGFSYGGEFPFFALVPKKYLKGLEPLPLDDEDKYVKKLAGALHKFLDELYVE